MNRLTDNPGVFHPAGRPPYSRRHQLPRRPCHRDLSRTDSHRNHETEEKKAVDINLSYTIRVIKKD